MKPHTVNSLASTCRCCGNSGGPHDRLCFTGEITPRGVQHARTFWSLRSTARLSWARCIFFFPREGSLACSCTSTCFFAAQHHALTIAWRCKSSINPITTMLIAFIASIDPRILISADVLDGCPFPPHTQYGQSEGSVLIPLRYA
jgi:hypothetical protein